jgi:non-specific serine/threonine protein kinase
MSIRSERLSRFWNELKRRKVIPILIAYLAACFAIIEFTDITSSKFSIPDSTFNMLYILAAIGLPLAVILPWYINRKNQETTPERSASEEKIVAKDEKQELHNLPTQLTSFIGREKEMQVVNQLISEHRLVTLVGAGGCGKTRLAIEVAANILADYKDGVWFVDLAPIAMGDLVSKEIMDVLKINEAPDKPRMDTLLEQIKDKNMLLILDNCEHLVEACAEVAGKLIQLIPGLNILTTTRESLCIKGEQVWRVPSLTLIDPKSIINVEHARDSEAVLLFTDRARLNNPEFELEAANVNEVITICNKLDGIPLAVELVASRTKHMNARTILERFSDRFDQLASFDPDVSKRQQTLQATIDWSYNLLSDVEKLLFVRLAVFSGGFDIEAAEEVCSDDLLPKEDILDVLSRLVDRSLVNTTKGAEQSQRYNRLETLRQFAWKKLQTQNEEEVIRQRHLEYYLRLSEQAYKEQFQSQLKWLNWLEQEHDNLVAALNWSFTESKKKFILLTGYLGWFWYLHSHLILGKDYLEKAISEDSEKSEAYARVLAELGRLAFYSTEKSGPIEFMKESLGIWRKTNNLREQAIVLGSLGRHASRTDDFETVLKYNKEGMQLARKVGDQELANRCLADLCQSYIQLQQYDQARPYVEELVITSEKLQQPWEIVLSHHFRGDCALGTKEFKEAEKEYGHAVISAQKFGNTAYIAIDLQGVAFALAGQSRWDKSIRLDAAARKIYDQIGMQIEGVAEFWDVFVATYTEHAKKEAGEELTRKYQEEGRAMETEQAVEYALDFEKD